MTCEKKNEKFFDHIVVISFFKLNREACDKKASSECEVSTIGDEWSAIVLNVRSDRLNSDALFPCQKTIDRTVAILATVELPARLGNEKIYCPPWNRNIRLWTNGAPFFSTFYFFVTWDKKQFARELAYIFSHISIPPPKTVIARATNETISRYFGIVRKTIIKINWI